MKRLTRTSALLLVPVLVLALGAAPRAVQEIELAEAAVFIEFNSVPPWMRAVAGIFPLRWLAAGMRSVFLPDRFETAGETPTSFPAPS